MKIVSLLLVTGSVSAFTSPSSTARTTSLLKMADTIEEPPTPEVVEPVSKLPTMSQALPFLTRPAALDGTLAGDVGFDPLGFSKSREDLMNFREAEIKHARLAMLVSVIENRIPSIPVGAMIFLTRFSVVNCCTGCCWMATL
jgi:hypothetical protein